MKTKAAKTRASEAVTKSNTAVRGKYFNQLPKGTNLAIINPDIHAHFPESVNRAHALLAIREHLKATKPATTKRQIRVA